ncbi:MAG TPA: hypothetical protein VFT30_04580 [Nitrospira sp.]|nr:hypothetical protein [Nitrospira sp.]
MLELKVHDGEREVVLRFEHSLLSLSKWESKYKKPFMVVGQKSAREMLDYYECMLLPPEDDPDLLVLLDPEQMDQLTTYINEPQTASSVPDEGRKGGDGETITSELIYYWLSQMRIPFQPTETWHLSRIVMLVQITGWKQQPAKKRKPAEVYREWIAENERRKKLFKTRG